MSDPRQKVAEWGKPHGAAETPRQRESDRPSAGTILFETSRSKSMVRLVAETWHTGARTVRFELHENERGIGPLFLSRFIRLQENELLAVADALAKAAVSS